MKQQHFELKVCPVSERVSVQHWHWHISYI